MGMCFFDVAVPGGWHKGYESQVWFGVWLGGMIRGMARAPLNSQATRDPIKRCLRGSAAAQSGPPPAPVTNQRKGKTA